MRIRYLSSAIRILLVGTLLVTATGLFAQGDSFKVYYGRDFWDVQNQIANDKMSAAMQQNVRDLARVEGEVRETRRAYWRSVASGRSDPKLKSEYADALSGKDVAVLWGMTMSGQFSGSGASPNPMEMLVYAPAINFDGGIPWAARGEFLQWGGKVAQNLENRLRSTQGGLAAIGELMTAILRSTELPEYQTYVNARNRAEYDSSGLPARFTPEDYLDYLLDGAYATRTAAVTVKAILLENLDRAELTKVADEIRRAPRNEKDLAVVDGAEDAPHRLFRALVPHRFPRAYAASVAWLTVSRGSLAERQADDYWSRGFGTLAQLESAFGKELVTTAAERIREKQPWGPDYFFQPRNELRAKTFSLTVGEVEIQEYLTNRAFLGQLILANPNAYLLKLAGSQRSTGNKAEAATLIAELRKKFPDDRFQQALADLLLALGMGYGDARKSDRFQVEFKDAAFAQSLRNSADAVTRYGVTDWQSLIFDDRAAYELFNALLAGDAHLVPKPPQQIIFSDQVP
jgi:hypothetical protein